MTKQEKLLGHGLKTYIDYNNTATIIPCTYLLGTNGLAYLLKDEESAEEIKCAIHIDSNTFQESEASYDAGIVSISIQQNIFDIFNQRPSYIIVSYEDYLIGIKDLGGYNEINGTYSYTGQIINNKNKNLIITDSSVAAELFLSNSTVYWLLFGTYCGITVYPSFLVPINSESTYLSIEIINTRPICPVWQYDDDTKKQKLIDHCKLSLINGTLNDAQNVINYLDLQAEEKEYFGLMDFVAFSQKNSETQQSFNIKSNIRSAEFNINYELESDSEEALKYIESALFTMSAIN